jgi:hypothetical protein
MFYGPDNFGMNDLSIDVAVKLPGSIVTAAKIIPSLSKQFPAYAHEFQKETARVTGTVDAINIGLQSVAVAGIFGVIIFALLSREKGK